MVTGGGLYGTCISVPVRSYLCLWSVATGAISTQRFLVGSKDVVTTHLIYQALCDSCLVAGAPRECPLGSWSS